MAISEKKIFKLLVHHIFLFFSSPHTLKNSQELVGDQLPPCKGGFQLRAGLMLQDFLN